MRVGSLASGGGGLDLAVAALWPDATLAWVAETDPHASTVLAARFPDTPNLGDVRSIDATAPPVDVLVGGLPCQPYSTAGQRKGAADDRDLLPAAVRLAGELGPRLVLLENVASLVRAPEWRTLLGGMADIGYDVRWGVVRASDLGACHRRARLFAAAHPHGGDVRAESVGVGGRSDPPVAGGAGTQRLLPTPTRRDGRGVTRLGRSDPMLPDAVALLATPRAADGMMHPLRNPSAIGNPRGRLEDQVALLPTPEASDAIGSRRALVFGGHRPSGAKRSVSLMTAIHHRFGAYQPAVERHAALLDRPAPEPVDDKRRLNPRFVEWMMCWPDGWVTNFDLPRTAMLRILGNGVVPAQAAAAYRMLGVAP